MYHMNGPWICFSDYPPLHWPSDDRSVAYRMVREINSKPRWGPLNQLYRRIVLPDSPTKAKFLSREEKVIAVERLRANNMVNCYCWYFFNCTNQAVGDWNENLEVGTGFRTGFRLKELFMVCYALPLRVRSLLSHYILLIVANDDFFRLPSGGIGTFGPLIIKGFGFNQV